jgi:hypothetical protein
LRWARPKGAALSFHRSGRHLTISRTCSAERLVDELVLSASASTGSGPRPVGHSVALGKYRARHQREWTWKNSPGPQRLVASMVQSIESR